MTTGVRVRVAGISKKYDEITALEAVELVANPGEVTVIAGPSGSGKSTLLRIISGLEDPDEGKIYFDERDVTTLPPWERKSVMLSQRPVLLPHLTILENLILAAGSQGLSRVEAMEEALRIASFLGIKDLLDRKPGTLSGGQLQRASLAAVISAGPRVLLLDEPFAHLDLPLREYFRRLVKEVAMRQGLTIIQVTHDQDEALELADKLVVLINGRVMDEGEPIRVYYDPASIDVAIFLGHNVACSHPLFGEKEVPVSFPPEAVVLGDGPQYGVVEYVASRKHYTIVYLRVDNTVFKTIVPGVHRFAQGTVVSFKLEEPLVKEWSEAARCTSVAGGYSHIPQ